MITREFLEGKLFKCPSTWTRHNMPVLCKSSSGNIHKISENVLKFTQYNFLPTSQEDILDGHYTFYVNKEDFSYLMYKSSDYKNFVSVATVDFDKFITDLPEISRKRVESVIAHKLLGAYEYDCDAVNSKGKSVIEPEQPEPAGGTFREHIVRYTNPKGAMVVDHRGEIWTHTHFNVEKLSNADLKALKSLVGWVPPNVPEMPEKLLKSIRAKLQASKGKAREKEFMYGGEKYTIWHHVDKVFGKRTALFMGKRLLTTVSLDHSLTKFIRLIPEIIKNYPIENN